MRVLAYTAMAAAAALAALMQLACDSRPTTPTAPATPTAPRAAVTRVEISGPGTIAPGQSAQFTAVGYLSDGGNRDITSEVGWRSSRSHIISISATGLATAVDRGESNITADLRPLGATKPVIAVPIGTYRLMGTVREGGLSIDGARLEITSGPGAGLSTTSASGGRYALYGVAGETELRTAAEGYQPHVQRLQVTDHQVVDLELTPSRPRTDFSGRYTLTIRASDSCAGNLPEGLRVRTYAAEVTQEGPKLAIRLSGAKFIVDPTGHGNRFAGTLDPASEQATMQLAFWAEFYYQNWIDQHPDVIENLEGSRHLVIAGSVSAGATSHGLSGTLAGALQIIDSADLRRFQRVAICDTDAHSFTLTR